MRKSLKAILDKCEKENKVPKIKRAREWPPSKDNLKKFAEEIRRL